MSKMVSLGIPDDPTMLRALGRLAVAHGNLEMVQIMCLKTLEGLAPDAALQKFRRCSARNVRIKIGDIVAGLAGPSDQKVHERLKELLRDARCASERRNAYLHRFWAKRSTGGWVTSPDESHWDPLPEVAAIEDLVGFIHKTMVELNQERFEGGIIFDFATRASAAEQAR